MGNRAAVFDMDGTVLNTVTDLRIAINHAMGEAGHENDFTDKDTCLFFGSGVEVAVQRALLREKGFGTDDLLLVGTPGHESPAEIDPDETDRIIRIYRPYYAAHCEENTRAYPGIGDLLRRLRKAGIRTAVVSNKPDEAVQDLVERDFPAAFDFALGEKAGIRRKPAPDMTEEALKVLGAGKTSSVYIGDSEIDIETAKNSGIACISVDWGFRSRGYLEGAGAERIVSDPKALCEAVMRIVGNKT